MLSVDVVNIEHYQREITSPGNTYQEATSSHYRSKKENNNNNNVRTFLVTAS